MEAGLRLGGEKIFIWFVIFVGALISVAFGYFVGEDAVTTGIVLACTLGILAWVALARQRWWLIVPAAAGIGGYFWFGFKLYPHEVALLGAVVPLALSIAVRLSGTRIKRAGHFPLTMYLLSAYLVAHWIGSTMYNRMNGEAGFGSVSRGYFNALWVVIFVIAFWRYGSTRFIPTALFISYVAAFVRLFIGLVTYFASAFAYIPVINYVLPGSTHTRAADIRASALSLGIFAACYFLIHKGFLRRGFHGSVFLCSLIALLFGAGRGVLVLLCLVPVFLAVIYRQVIPVLLSVVIIGSGLVLLNVNTTEIMKELPIGVQRSISVLLVDKDEADSYARTASSDLWHERLREIGFQNWTQSWSTFFFGTGLRPPFLGQAEDAPLEVGMANAARIGAYESGWWTVIAVTGLVGLLLYLAAFFYLLHRLLPILLRDGVQEPRHAFAFISVYGIVVWLTLGWAQGGYPGMELLYGFLALCAFEDRRQHARPKRSPPPRLRPMPLPTKRPDLQPARR